MDKKQAIKMDKTIEGPILHCEYCGAKQVLSPCYFCQFFGNFEKFHCRGCGYNHRCKGEYEICWKLSKERFLLKLNEMLVKKRKLHFNFCEYGLKELPKEIGQLTSLKTLNLFDNRLSKVPEEIGLLDNLQTLNLGYNQLSKLPEEIGLLTNLQTLILQNNQLKELPVEIELLTNLKKLLLGGNQLRYLTTLIGSLINLEYFDLRGNPLNKNTIQLLRKTLPNTRIHI